MGSAGASLAGPRLWFFGSPGQADGVLRLSPVQDHGQVVTRLRFINESGQTFNQVSVKLGDNVSSDSLPAGAVISAVTGTNAGDCSISADGRSLTCAYGHVPKGARGTRDATVVIDLADAATGAVSVTAKAEINETQGTTNVDTSLATGSTTSFTADDDHKGGAIAKDDPAELATLSGGNGYGVKIALNRLSDGSDALAIRENVGTLDCGLVVCITDPIQLFINFGDKLDPPADVFVTFDSKSTKFGGLFHLLDDGTLVDITNDKAHTCSNKVLTDCIFTTKLGVLGVRLSSNGVIRVH